MKVSRAFVKTLAAVPVLAAAGLLVWFLLTAPALEIKTIEVRGPVNHMRQVVDNMDRVVSMLKAYPERIDARYKNAFAAQLPPKTFAAAAEKPTGKAKQQTRITTQQ